MVLLGKLYKDILLMSKVIKYIISTFITLSLLLFYVLYTDHGKSQLYKYLSYSLSQKSDLDIEVKSIEFGSYNYITTQVLIEKKYHLKAEGLIDTTMLDMKYTIQSDCIKTDKCNINDMVFIRGNIKGEFGDLYASGNGRLLDGKIKYHLNKQKNILKDVNITIDELNSTKFGTLLGEDLIFEGKANTNIYFSHLDKKKKRGKIIYDIRDHNYSDLDLNIHLEIDIKDQAHKFKLDIDSNEIKLHINRGKYNQKSKLAYAFYTLDISELSHIERLLGDKYYGKFYAIGEIHHDKKIEINGLSKSLGGMLDFHYKSDTIKLDMQKIPFANLMKLLNINNPIDAIISGDSYYNIKEKSLTSKSKLDNLKILPSKSIDNISQKIELNITKEVFDNNYIDIKYQNDSIIGDVKLSNSTNHLILKDTEIKIKKKSINGIIDLKIKKHTASGKIYTKLDDYISNRESIYLQFDGTAEKHYRLNIDGSLSMDWINIDYGMRSHRLPSHICTIVDDVNISGYINGSLKRLHIFGKGSAMNGSIGYDGIKIGDRLQDVNITLRDIRSQKLSTLLGYPTLPHGKADININFGWLSKTDRKGHISYHLKSGVYEELPLSIDAKIDTIDNINSFKADASFGNIDINMSKGIYNSNTEVAQSFYLMSSPDLSQLESILKSKYSGAFAGVGMVKYDKFLHIQGLSKTYGGILDYSYKKDRLDIDLDNVSFSRIISILNYPEMIDAQAYGNINYDFNTKLLGVKSKLKKARFLPSDLVNSIKDKADVNISTEIFDNSSLDLTYHKNILLGDLKLMNKKNHFLLTNTIMNTDKDTINAYFDFKMQSQSFSGKVVGTIDDLKVNLNIQKLIEFQMDKQIDSMVGKQNREMMESMPMGTVAKDVATETAASFMGIFF